MDIRTDLSLIFAAAFGALSIGAEDPPIRVKPASEEKLKDHDSRGGTVDWSTIPPWRQSSFFGVRAQGRVFVFVVDCSGSMDGERIVRAKSELRRTLSDLRFPQRASVVFFNDRTWTLAGGDPMPSDYASKQRLMRWLQMIDAEGATEPRPAMQTALAQAPDAIYFLTDGDLPPATAEAIGAMNRAKVPIHCIDLSGGDGAAALRAIAEQSGGSYVAR